jgi:hypothetical protein
VAAALAATTPKPAVEGQPVAQATPAEAPATAEAPAPAKKVVARVDRKPQQVLPPAVAEQARLNFAIAPWGEVIVNGKRRGLSPPLRMLEISPGTHTIEIRNSTFPAHVEKVEIKAGEAVRIRHRFR